MKDQSASSFIDEDYIDYKFNVFRLTQSLDDPTLLFWSPKNVKDDWPFIFFLKLGEGTISLNKDLKPSV